MSALADEDYKGYYFRHNPDYLEGFPKEEGMYHPEKYTGCFSRMEIEAFEPPKNSVLISITDPDSEVVKLADYWRAVYFDTFWDTEPIKPDRIRFPELAKLMPPATDTQIAGIYRFIQDHSTYSIFAHCEAGVSRSAAVREFLLRRGFEPYGEAQKNRMVHPNAYIIAELEKLDRNV